MEIHSQRRAFYGVKFQMYIDIQYVGCAVCVSMHICRVCDVRPGVPSVFCFRYIIIITASAHQRIGAEHLIFQFCIFLFLFSVLPAPSLLLLFSVYCYCCARFTYINITYWTGAHCNFYDIPAALDKMERAPSLLFVFWLILWRRFHIFHCAMCIPNFVSTFSIQNGNSIS